LEVPSFAIGHAILPAAPDDADPFERQRPDGRVMTFASLSLQLVVGPCPDRVPDRVTGKFMKRLTDEFGCCPAPVDPTALSALLRDRCDPAVLRSEEHTPELQSRE